MINSSEVKTTTHDDDEIDDENTSESTYLIHAHQQNKSGNKHVTSYGSPPSPQRTPSAEKSDKSFYQLYSTQLLNALGDKRSKFQLSASVYLLLLVNGLERFAYYGLICNYILYLNKQPLYWESYNASFILFIFLGNFFTYCAFSGEIFLLLIMII